mmetsp:Transcript_1475/g.4801  ORF Transcript_1475/g.4801 Transcript_1475/m.4801 type:complete len:335 (-) Transcript_1475:282-1286(-)
MKRRPGLVHEAMDAVQLRLRHVVLGPVNQLHPSRRGRGLLHREQARAQDAGKRNLALERSRDLRLWVERPHSVLHGRGLLLGHQVALAQDHDVRKLDLLGEKRPDASLVALVDAPLELLLHLRVRCHVRLERGHVHHRHARVEPRNLVQRDLPSQRFHDRLHRLGGRIRHRLSRLLVFLLLLFSLFFLFFLYCSGWGDVCEEGIRDLARQGDAGRLHNDGVEGVFLVIHQVRQRLHEVLPQRTADAPVVQLDQLLLRLEKLAITHQVRVNIHFRHVVHKHRNLVLPPVGLLLLSICWIRGVRLLEDTLQQCRLPRAEETRQQSHRNSRTTLRRS